MTLNLTLHDDDLREMPAELRDKLLEWYFSHAPSVVNASGDPAIPKVPKRKESGRISFPEFVREGSLKPGAQLVCKTLRHQRRGGSERFIEAGKVLADGSVEYNGQSYDVPSKLAVDVINNNGGNAEALNGYDYLFVRSSNRSLQKLGKLRDRLLKAGSA